MSITTEHPVLQADAPLEGSVLDRQVRHVRRRIGIEMHAATARPFAEPHLLDRVSQLEEESRRRDTTIAGAAHEMQAPIAVLSGYLQLLEQQRIGALSQQQLEALEIMKISCARLDHLVSEFVTYGLLGSGRAVVRFETNEIAPTMHQLVRQWKPAFDIKNVALNLQFGSEVRPFPFDRHRVEQVISNLLDNALRFTPAHGTVSIMAALHFWQRRMLAQPRVMERRCEQRTEPNSVFITVSDTGPGIAAESRQEIFEPFYSLTYGKGRPGTGLGLAIARGIVQAHGGKIWVESEVSKGSRFCVVLPW